MVVTAERAMTVQLVPTPGPTPNAGATITALVMADGSAAHSWVGQLRARVEHRDLADAVHTLCAMHGMHPGLIERAQARSDDIALADWLGAAVAAFAAERAFLATIVAAVGPLPSTPGHAQAEAAIAAQRHALDMLANSDRAGCAIGAAAALVIDWHGVRPLLESIAIRAGIATPVLTLSIAEPARPASAAIDRARLFGAQQFLAQQRGLWSLLEARAAARAHH